MKVYSFPGGIFSQHRSFLRKEFATCRSKLSPSILISFRRSTSSRKATKNSWSVLRTGMFIRINMVYHIIFICFESIGPNLKAGYMRKKISNNRHLKSLSKNVFLDVRHGVFIHATVPTPFVRILKKQE